MSGYISREAVIKALCERSEPCFTESGEPTFKGDYIGAIEAIPAADVVEVDVKDLRVKKAIKTLCEFYSTAKKSDYVQKPLAWALYQTWRTFNEMDGGVNDGKAD